MHDSINFAIFMTYSRSKTRQFLSDYFNDNELTNLCFDYFPLVENNFTLGMGKDQKIRELIVYCENRGKTDGLVAALERERPELYEHELKEAFESPISRPLPKKPERNQNQIFLSHSSEDAELANELADALRKHGWELWMAPDSILPGEKWAEAINRGLEESGTFLLLMTRAVLQSRWVKSETNFAIEMEHKGEMSFIPLAHEAVELPPLWRGYQSIPFSILNKMNLEVLLATLDRRPVRVSPAAGPIHASANNRQPIRETERKTKKVASAQAPSAQTKTLGQAINGLPLWSWGAGIVVLLSVGIVVLLIVFGLRFFGVIGGAAAYSQLSPSVLDRVYCENVFVVANDEDNDGLSAAQEAAVNSDPNNADSDGDGLCDGYEIDQSGTDPTVADSNGDGVSDFDHVFPDGNTEPDRFKPENVNGHEWIEIPAGPFTMGSTDDDPDAGEFEKPQHQVDLSIYWIAKHETTNAQYKLFIDAGGHSENIPRGQCEIWDLSGTYKDQFADYPVNCASWFDALAYAEWLGSETGYEISLPSEAEWEKAARGLDGNIFPWGNKFDGQT
ncbi:MAG: sulfatase activating formylglycine-generating enzyme [Cellvibrionaceae bacterium]